MGVEDLCAYSRHGLNLHVGYKVQLGASGHAPGVPYHTVGQKQGLGGCNLIFTVNR